MTVSELLQQAKTLRYALTTIIHHCYYSALSPF
jgi:hypothetical protein